MNNIKIDKDLLTQIIDFVELNELGEPNEFIHKLIRDGFMQEKYGDLEPNAKKMTDKSDNTEEVKDGIKVDLNKRDIYDE